MTTVKEGWISKRGEYVQNWRSRWFVLKSDGTFRGYKSPPAEGDMAINVFEIANSNIANIDSKKGGKQSYGFCIRFVQLTRMIERYFGFDTEAERDSWVKAYQDVQRKLNERLSATVIMDRTAAMSFEDSVARPCTIGLDDFEMLKVLGKGTFGKVMLVRHKSNHQIYAMKVLKKHTVLQKDELAHTLAENNVLAKCSHTFLTAMKFSFQTSDLLCFVMEYVNGGEVFYHLQRDKKFGEERGRFYSAEITSAITYLHSQGIIYRDLKLENLLLDKDGHIKITDFGLCKEEITFGSTTSTFCGTPEYLAPEVIEDSDYSREVDWWGVGVVLYEMITGRLPFHGASYEELFDAILKNDVIFPPSLSEAAKSIISGLLIKNPSERLGGSKRDGKDVMAHPFYASINFDKLVRREIKAPFIPVVKDELDSSNFDPAFTSEPVKLTPPSRQLTKDDDEVFEGFQAVMRK